MSLFGESYVTEMTRGSFWQTYTPTLLVTTTPTGGTISYQDTQGKYIQNGKVVFVHVNFRINSITGGAPAFVSVTLPSSSADSRFGTAQFHATSYLWGFNDLFGGGPGSNTLWYAPISQDSRNKGAAGYIQASDGTSIANTFAGLPIRLTLQGWYIKE